MSFPAVLALALAATGPRLEASLTVGAGYDSNLNHAETGADRVDAAFGFLGASGGVSLDLGRSTSAFAGLRADVERYPELSDLGSTSAGAQAALVRELGWRVAVILAPAAFRSWTGDPDRDAVGFSGRLTLRVKPTRHVALRAFYSYVERDAADPVFSSQAHRVGGGVEWNPHGRTYLSAGYAEARGDEVFYRPVAPGGLPGMGRYVDVFGRNEEPFRASALSRSITGGLEVGLGSKVHLFCDYTFRRVTSDQPTFAVHAVTAGIGARP